MCLSHPAKIITINGNQALVEDANKVKHKIFISTVPDAKLNDWILINANLALQKISASEAKEINNLFLNKKHR